MELLEKILKTVSYIVLAIFILYFLETMSVGIPIPQSHMQDKGNTTLEVLAQEAQGQFKSMLNAGHRLIENQSTGNKAAGNQTRQSNGDISYNYNNESGYEEISLPLILPVEGNVSISSGFGVRRDPFTGRNAFHNGIDIPLPTGTPVRSTGNGFVSKTGYSSRLGKFITINHGSSYQTIYGHLSTIRVQSGQRVQMGDILGYSGNTGRSTNPHLHYQINYRGQPRDPILIKRELTSR